MCQSIRVQHSACALASRVIFVVRCGIVLELCGSRTLNSYDSISPFALFLDFDAILGSCEGEAKELE
jgi:hypothetical protein